MLLRPLHLAVAGADFHAAASQPSQAQKSRRISGSPVVEPDLEHPFIQHQSSQHTLLAFQKSRLDSIGCKTFVSTVAAARLWRR